MSNQTTDRRTNWMAGQQFAMVPVGVITNPRFRKLPASTLRVYLTLALHSGPDGQPWVSARRLAELSGVELWNINTRGVNPLIEAGLVERNGQHGETSRFRLILPGVNAGVNVNESVSVNSDVNAPANAGVNTRVHAGVNVSDPSSDPTTDPDGAAVPLGASASLVEDPAQAQRATPVRPFEPSQAATPSTPRESNRGKQAKPKTRKRGFDMESLDDQEKTLISTLTMMERYLLWGRAGLYEMDDAKLKPETMNWRAVTNNNATDRELRVRDWGVAHFVGYYWFLVSKYNAEHNLPIALPERGWGRLFRDMATLMSSMTNTRLANRIYRLYLFMDLIKVESAWMNIPPAFNETTLSDNNLSKTIAAIEASGDVELTGRWEKAGYACVVRNGIPMTPEQARAAA